MITVDVKRTTSEVANRAWEIYDQRLKALLEPDEIGKFLVVDIDSGDYEIDADEVAVMLRAAERFPTGRRFGMRIGYRTMGQIGSHLSSTKPLRLVES